MATLYQKYRPQRFADVAGQEVVKTTLQNELAAGTTVHAYIFAGPRAVGKTTTARLLARSLNCLNRKAGESEPCNECENCVAILAGKTLDVLEIDAASNRGIDNVRDNIMVAARVASAQLKHKVFILDEVHMLTIESFNALLKLLEEPPKNVVFILATTELHKVPATIVSRCQRFDFKRIAPDSLLARLKSLVEQESKKIDESVLSEIVRRTGGCARDAESLLGQVLSLGSVITAADAALVLPHSDYTRVKELACAMFAGVAPDAFAQIRRAVEEGADLPTFASDLTGYVRNLLMMKLGTDDAIPLTVEEAGEAMAVIASIAPERLVLALDYLIAAQKDVKWFTLPQVPLELAVARVIIDSERAQKA